jgi:pimeloyl-ACP methyl ester carboxylesterase
MDRRKIKLTEVEIAYVEQNESQDNVILCLHALGHSSKDYEKLFSDARYNKFRIIALDFPNHGNSSLGTKSVSTQYYTEIVEEFIAKLKLQHITLLGNSIGGGVSIRLAHNKKNNIQMLQLANTAGLDKRGFLGKIFINFMVSFFKSGERKSKLFPRIFKYYYENVLPETEATERREEIIRTGYEIAPLLVQGWKSFALPTEDLRGIASEIECPILVTWAMKDKKVQYGRNIEAIKKMKNYKLLKYKAGHTPILESSKQFLTELFDFINSNKVSLA